MVEYLNQNKYAKLLGITRQAVSIAVKDGRVKMIERGIDPTHPDNVHFANRTYERAEAKKKANGRKKKKPAKAKASTEKTAEEKTAPPEIPPDIEKFILTTPTNKAEADLQKAIAATKKITMEIAVKMRTMIPKEEVADAFGNLSASIMDFFLPLGERLAPTVAGLAGCSDPAVIAEIRHTINDDVSRCIEEVKRQAIENGAKVDG